MIKLNTTQKISLSTVKELKEILKNINDDMRISDFIVEKKLKEDLEIAYKISFNINE